MTNNEIEPEAITPEINVRLLPLVKLLELCDLEDVLTRELVRRIQILRRHNTRAEQDISGFQATIARQAEDLRQLRRKVDELERDSSGFDDGTPDGFLRSL